MIESNEKLSQTRQCQLLSLARSTFYYQPQPLDNEKLALLRKLDEQYLKTPNTAHAAMLPGLCVKVSVSGARGLQT